MKTMTDPNRSAFSAENLPPYALPARLGDVDACLLLGDQTDEGRQDVEALTGYPIEIRPVPYGMGVFAKRHFAPGETVLSSGVHRIAKERTATSFEVWPGGKHAELEWPAYRINHSCDPNCGVRDNARGGYDFIAGPDGIAAGTEIRTHYGMHEWRSLSVPGGCQCGAENCQGRAKGWSELGPLIQNDMGIQFGVANHLVADEVVRGVICHLQFEGCQDAPETVDQWRAFIGSLCRKIGVTPHGEPVLSDYGRGLLSGWTWMQMVDASSITGHFFRSTGTGWIDIQSCRAFQPEPVAMYAAQRLGAVAYGVGHFQEI